MGYPLQYFLYFPSGSDSREFTCNAEDMGSIPGLGRSSGGGDGNPGNFAWKIPMERGAWWATVHGITESQLSN